MKKSPLTLINKSVWFPGSAQAPWWMATSDKCPVNGWVLCVKISSAEAAVYKYRPECLVNVIFEFREKIQNRDGKSNSRIKTELPDMNRYDIWKRIFENTLQPLHKHAHSHLNLQCARSRTFDLPSPILKHGKIWRVDAELVCSALVHTAARLTFVCSCCLPRWYVHYSESPRVLVVLTFRYSLPPRRQI